MSSKRLSPEMAKALGLDVKPIDREKEAFGNPKYYLNKKKLKQYNKINNIFTGGSIQKWLILPDVHRPFHNRIL